MARVCIRKKSESPIIGKVHERWSGCDSHRRYGAEQWRVDVAESCMSDEDCAIDLSKSRSLEGVVVT